MLHIKTLGESAPAAYHAAERRDRSISAARRRCVLGNAGKSGGRGVHPPLADRPCGRIPEWRPAKGQPPALVPG
jgi:hypothetical protein